MPDYQWYVLRKTRYSYNFSRKNVVIVQIFVHLVQMKRVDFVEKSCKNAKNALNLQSQNLEKE